MIRLHTLFVMVALLSGLLNASHAQQSKAEAYGRAIQDVQRQLQKAEANERRKAIEQERLRQERLKTQEAEARRAEAQARAEAEQRRAAVPDKNTVQPPAATPQAAALSARHVGRLVLPIRTLKEALVSPFDTAPDLQFDGLVLVSPGDQWAAGLDEAGRLRVWSLDNLQVVEPGAGSGFTSLRFFGADAVLATSHDDKRLLLRLVPGQAPAPVQLPDDARVAYANAFATLPKVGEALLMTQPRSAKACSAVLAVDPTTGRVTQRMQVNVPASSCEARQRGTSLVAIASDDQHKRHWVLRDGEEIGSFQTAEPWWVDWKDEFFTVNTGSGTELRSVVSARPGCRLPADSILVPLGDRLVLMGFGQNRSMPGFYDASRCVLDARGAPGQRLAWLSPGHWALVDDAAGVVDVLEGEGPTVKRRLTVPRPAGVSNEVKYGVRYMVVASGPGRVAVVDLNAMPHQATLFDTPSGEVIGEVPAVAVSGSAWAVRNTDVDPDPAKLRWRSELWREQRLQDKIDGRRKLTELLTRDPYETTDAWRRRVDAANHRQFFGVELKNYDPDTGRYVTSFFDATLELRMPPDVARQLRGQTEATVLARLRIADAQHLELADPELFGPDNTRLAALLAPATGGCAADLAGLAPAMRPYRHPRLADLRVRILATRIDDTLDKAQAQGLAPNAALAATRQQQQTYAQEAQQLLDTADGRARGDLQRAVSDTLDLGYSCDTPQGQQVCRFLERAWQAKASLEVAKALACRI